MGDTDQIRRGLIDDEQIMGDPLSDASLDGILAKYELERKDLNFRCPRGIIDRIADEIVDDWHKIGRALNISDAKLKSIMYDATNHLRSEDKAVATLDTWAEEYGSRATCLSLARVLYRNKKRSVVEILCEEVQRFKARRVKTRVTRAAANHHPRNDDQKGINLVSHAEYLLANFQRRKL